VGAQHRFSLPTLEIGVAPVTRSQFVKVAEKAKNAVPVRRVGELAFSQYTAGESLTVWQHGVWMSIDLTGVSSPVATAKALARAALKRL